LDAVGLVGPAYAFPDVAATVYRVSTQAAISLVDGGELCPQADRVDYRSLSLGMSVAAWRTPFGIGVPFTGTAAAAENVSTRVRQFKPLSGSKAISGTG